MSNFDESKVNRQKDGKFGFKKAGGPVVTLSRDEYFDMILSNDETSDEAAEFIASEYPDLAFTHSNPNVRSCYAQRADLPVEHQRALSKDEDTGVRQALSCNPSVEKDILKQMLLSENEHPLTRHFACCGLSLQERRELINSDDDEVRSCIAATGEPEFLQTLKDDPSPKVRKSVAWKCNESDVDYYANDPDDDVRMVVARRSRNIQVLQQCARERNNGIAREALERICVVNREMNREQLR
ncbi:HEAT repeat domain-containing protein [Actinomyces vulturis]|uniref:HEAT repeat domain-containing protein n=1 Tax=Actinomyces vulturis TaxID=1857645 RepID=UPI00082BDA6F|nr:HEAT repeat domain-containing protein [Actinomyces vulturis]